MNVVSVNVARARSVPHAGGMVSTGIFKEPVDRRVRVRTLGLDGDEQADLRVHGGPTKAVYAYPMEHYAFWHAELPDMELPWGSFGENLTIAGLREREVHVGDRFRCGTAVLAATKPRFPCAKLGIRFGRDDMIDRFLRSGRSGIYCAVIEEGYVAAGDRFERVHHEERAPTIADMVRTRIREKGIEE